MPRTKRPPRIQPSFERVSKLLSYDPSTGVLHWRVKQGRCAAGYVAGRVSDRGYTLIQIDSHAWHAHRLGWLLTYGSLPACDLDHINGDRSDNRLANLRLATRSENNGNSRPQSGKMYSDHKGVTFDKNKGLWVAQIRVNGRGSLIGRFGSEVDAAAAYARAASEAFGEFARTT